MKYLNHFEIAEKFNDLIGKNNSELSAIFQKSNLDFDFLWDIMDNVNNYFLNLNREITGNHTVREVLNHSIINAIDSYEGIRNLFDPNDIEIAIQNGFIEPDPDSEFCSSVATVIICIVAKYLQYLMSIPQKPIKSLIGFRYLQRESKLARKPNRNLQKILQKCSYDEMREMFDKCNEIDDFIAILD